MAKLAAPPEPDLLAAVSRVLDEAGILGVRRVVRHCGRRNAIAIHGEFLDLHAAALESAGYEVRRMPTWLEVTERPAGYGRMAS